MQAVIITAYKNFDQLKKLAYILSKEFEVFIHIDKKSQFENTEPLFNSSHIHIYSIYSVNWGGSNHLKAILHLMNDAMNQQQIDYFHILSGDSWPITDTHSIACFFEEHKEINMLCTKLKDMDRNWYKTVSKWQKYYSFLDVFDYKSIPQKIFVKSAVKFQEILGVDRFRNLDMELAQGLVWGSLPADAVKDCFDYIYWHPEFLNFLEYGHAPEEFFFQSILSNITKWEGKITNKNYQYMNWNKRNGSYPAILDISDYDAIQKGTFFFVRKIDFPISNALIDKLGAPKVTHVR